MDEELTQIEIGVTQSAIRMIKAYSSLSGKSSTEVAGELGVHVSGILEEQLKKKIALELGITTQAAPITKKSRVQVSSTFADVAGISDGLGDEDPEAIEGEDVPTALVPQAGGLTDESLANDMLVDDPNIEAAGEAPTWAQEMATEELFVDTPPNYVDPRIAKRKKRPGGKGRATPAGLNPSEDSP